MKFSFKTCAVLASLLVMILSCQEQAPNKMVKAKTITFEKEGTLKIVSATDSIVKQLDIEIADDEYQRQTGLMYRTSMEDTQGMLFIFEKEDYRSFYMKNTEIGLDIIYINSELSIVSIQENAKPLDLKSLPSNAPAQYVLEVNAGNVARWGVKEGDKISFNRP